MRPLTLDNPPPARPADRPVARLAAWAARLRADAAAVAGLALIGTLLAAVRVIPLEGSLRGDWGAFFLPLFGHLGARLRAGDIPGWNPGQFAGVPFAADPESGWGSLLAMATFTALPPAPAVAAYLLSTVALAGFGAYALARALGLGPFGAFTAAATFAFGWLWEVNLCCIPFAAVAAWLPWALLGVELALRAGSWRQGGAWCALAGLAISQILAGWLGQGATYALLVVASWTAWRGFVAPAIRGRAIGTRALATVGVGLTSLALGTGLAAVLLVPAISYNLRSNLAGGAYDGWSAWAAQNLGFLPLEVVQEVAGGYAGSIWWYAGAAALVLALLAPLAARDWSPWPPLLTIAVAACVLALREPTPVHRLLFALLPPFETLHVHFPARVLIVAYLPISLLAGATVDRTRSWRPRSWLVAMLCLAPAGTLAVVGPLTDRPELISRPALASAVAAALLVAAVAVDGGRRLGAPVPFALVAVLLLDPASRIALAGFAPRARMEAPLPATVEAYADATGGARFLRDEADGARFFGFAPSALDDPAAYPEMLPRFAYRDEMDEEDTVALLLLNRATLLGLEDVQGYNPVYPATTSAYFAAMNGHPQEYHELAVFPGALTSPLLDLLAARYVVIPRRGPSGRAAIAALPTDARRVYRDDAVDIVERPTALPLAWVVHRARAGSPSEALALLASGAVDGRTEAVLEATLPLANSTAIAESAVRSIARGHDRLAIEVGTDGSGLLIVSQAWDPGWRATIDGTPAPVLLANGALQAVAVPAGRSTVVLTYAPPGLALGIAVSLVSVFACAILVAAAHRSRRTPSG